jgi:hypothetical protein
MLTFPRSLARGCRAVFRALLPARGCRAAPPPVRLVAGPGGLRLRLATPEAAAKYHHPGPGGGADLAVPLQMLADCEGSDNGLVTVRPLPGGRVEARWEQAGVPHAREYDPGKAAPPPFPEWPEGATAKCPELLAALDQAMRTADNCTGRYALSHVLLRGGKGEVVATDGRQLLIQGGFAFPFKDEVLVPRVMLFGARGLPAGEVLVVRSADHVLFRVGGWTVALAIAKGGRFPNVDAVVPSPGAGSTRWRLGSGEAKALAQALPKLSGADEELAPVTVDLGRPAAVRARAGGQGRPAELPLPASAVEGKAVKFVTDRQYLARAVKLGFDSFQVLGPGRPVACQDGRRTYVWMTLDQTAVPPHPSPAQAERGRATRPSGRPGASPCPAGLRRRRATPRVAPAASAAGRLSLWAAGLRNLAGLVREHRRRERGG